MKSTVSILLASVALSASASLSAQDQQAKGVTAEEIAPAIRYALPHLYRGIQTRCAATLDPNGFLATNDERIYAKLSDGAEKNWGAAREGLIKLASKGEEGDSSQFLAQLPDAALKPFVDAAIPGLIASELKLEDCAMVEELMQTIDPLPADNFAKLVGMLVELGSRNDAEEDKATTRQ